MRRPTLCAATLALLGGRPSSPAAFGFQQIRIPAAIWSSAPSPRGRRPTRFLAPCSAALARAVPFICTDGPGFDRVAFHRDFNREVVRFFSTRLR